jgi:hypothetical protein
MVRGEYRRGSSYFCRLLGELMKRQSVNPSELSRKLQVAGYNIAQGSCYKYASGDRNPSAAFIVGAVRVLAEKPGDEEYLIASLKQAHAADFQVRLERGIAEELEKHAS